MEVRGQTNIYTSMVDRQIDISGEKLEDKIARRVRSCFPALVEATVAMTEMADAELFRKLFS